MEEVLEYLRPKKNSGLDNVKKLWILLAALVLSYAVLMIFPRLGQFMAGMVFVVIAVIVYFMLFFMKRMNLEYEYSLAEGILDVDVIRGKSSRKRIASIPCADIELLAWSKNPEHRQKFFDESIKKQYRAVFDPKAGGVYRILFYENGDKCCLSFQPPQDILEAMKRKNPRNIHIEQ